MEKKKTTAAKTLETSKEASYFGKKMYKRAIQAVEEGRPTAWSMVTWWEGEYILKAMGLEVVYPENWGAFCASQRVAEPHLDYADGDGFPPTLCGYARNTLGYARKMAEHNLAIPPDAPGGGMAKPVILVGSGTACDARYKWFQALGRYMEVPVYCLELPHPGVAESFLEGAKEHTIKFMTEDLREFVLFLEKVLDKKMDWDRLSELVDTAEKTRRLSHEVDLLRRAVPSPMVAQDFWACMIPLIYLSDEKESLEFYQKLYNEVKYKVDNKIAAIPNEKYRMMFSELPPWHSLGFFDELANDFGVAIVIESWNYHYPAPPPEAELEGVDDPLERIARWTHQWLTAYEESAREMGVEPGYFVQPYLDWASQYKVDGALLHPLFTCRPATYTLYHTGNLLLEKLKVPSVIIEGDIVDLRVFDEEGSKAKIGTFLETMEHYREVRRKEGLAW